LAEREGGGDLANGTRGITIFAVPYDSGHRALHMGAGPEHLLSNGMEAALAATGREIRSEVLEVASSFRAKIATAFELIGILAKRVPEATAKGSFPLVLSGNCNAGRVRRVHVHLDLDVLDPEAVDPANDFAPGGGLRTEEVVACIWAIRERSEVTSATVASYDPSFDGEGRVLRAGLTLAHAH
jgi:arginase family enzyme